MGANTIAHPALENNNKLYIGDGSLLAELDSLMAWTPNKLLSLEMNISDV